MSEITTVGVDIAKSVFVAFSILVNGTDGMGHAALRIETKPGSYAVMPVFAKSAIHLSKSSPHFLFCLP